MRYLQRKKDLAALNNYRKFEEIIFTNKKILAFELVYIYCVLNMTSLSVVNDILTSTQLC